MGAVFEHAYRQDLAEKIIVRNGGTMMFSGDSLSREISVKLYRDGAAATIEAGTTCVCYVIRPDGGTVTFAGTVTGHTVSATLPQSCFAVPGQIGVALQLVSGTTLTTVFRALYTVDRITTDTVIDPGSVVPDIAQLLDELDDMREATAEAEAVVASADAKVDLLALALIGQAAYIAVQPQDVTAAEGATAVFSVQVFALSGVTPTYQWQNKLKTASAWSDSGLSGSTTATLSVPVTSARYNYDWRCKVSYNNVDCYSDKANINAPEE